MSFTPFPFFLIFLSYFSLRSLLFHPYLLPPVFVLVSPAVVILGCLLCAAPGRGKALLHHLREVLCQAAVELLLIMADFSLNKLLISSSLMERLIRLGQEERAREDGVSGEEEERRRDGYLSVTQLSPCSRTAFQHP